MAGFSGQEAVESSQSITGLLFHAEFNPPYVLFAGERRTGTVGGAQQPDVTLLDASVFSPVKKEFVSITNKGTASVRASMAFSNTFLIAFCCSSSPTAFSLFRF
jgi:hypothetical protein